MELWRDAIGVVLWEIATLSELPYQGLSNDEVLSHKLMSECWQAEFSSRSTFLAGNYSLPAFKTNLFCCSRECEEAKLKEEQM